MGGRGTVDSFVKETDDGRLLRRVVSSRWRTTKTVSTRETTQDVREDGGGHASEARMQRLMKRTNVQSRCSYVQLCLDTFRPCSLCPLFARLTFAEAVSA